MCNKYIQEFVSTSPIQHFDFLFFLFFFILLLLLLLLFYFIFLRISALLKGEAN